MMYGVMRFIDKMDEDMYVSGCKPYRYKSLAMNAHIEILIHAT